MQHALTGLTAARRSFLDHEPTLGEMSDVLKALQGTLEGIEQRPAIALTPAALTVEIEGG